MVGGKGFGSGLPPSLSALYPDDASSQRPPHMPNVESIQNHETSTDVLGPPPDGGLWAWLQVLAAFLANFNSWGIINCFGVYQKYYQSDLLRRQTPFQISWINSLAGALAFFGTNFFGGFLDLGYVKPMGFCACLLQFAALMLLSWSKTYAEIILTQGLFVGLSSSLLFILTIGSVAPYFSKKRPLAIAIGMSGSSVGGTVYAVMANRLIEEVGFGWSTRIIAFMELGGTLVMFLLKRRLPPSPHKAFVAFECFKELPFMLYSVGSVAGFLALYVFYVYYESYATTIMPDEASFQYMTAIINAGSVIGRVLPAYVANRVGPFNVLVPAVVLSMILSFCWIAARNKGGIIAVGILFGIVSGPLFAMPGSIVAELTQDLNRLGIRLSFLFTFTAFGIVLGPPLAGMIERKYGWFWCKMYASLCWAVCLVCYVLARLSVSGLNLRRKV